MDNNRKLQGQEGENIAAKYLLDRGWKILDTNWRNGKSEVDVIAINEVFILFVEVKYRKSGEFGEAPDFVSKGQQKRIMNAAHEYIIENNVDQEARFDIIAIISEPVPRIEHIEEAFYPTL